MTDSGATEPSRRIRILSRYCGQIGGGGGGGGRPPVWVARLSLFSVGLRADQGRRWPLPGMSRWIGWMTSARRSTAKSWDAVSTSTMHTAPMRSHGTMAAPRRGRRRRQ
eukprot:1022742-Prymnesium_polylepis.1